MISELSSSSKHELCSFEESELRFSSGFILFKPDAVDLDIVEFLIAYIAEKSGLEIGVVKIITFTSAQSVELIYPDLPIAFKDVTFDYMYFGECVLVSYHSLKGDCDIWEYLKNLKGTSMWNWNYQGYDFSSQLGIQPFIRGLIPIPGTKEEYLPIMEKIRTRMRFTDDELSVYVKNLIHSPTTLAEYTALFDLLNEDEKKYFLAKIYENRGKS